MSDTKSKTFALPEIERLVLQHALAFMVSMLQNELARDDIDAETRETDTYMKMLGERAFKKLAGAEYIYDYKDVAIMQVAIETVLEYAEKAKTTELSQQQRQMLHNLPHFAKACARAKPLLVAILGEEFKFSDYKKARNTEHPNG